MSCFQNKSYTFARTFVLPFTKKCRKYSTRCGIGEFHALVSPYYFIVLGNCTPPAGLIFYCQLFVRSYSYIVLKEIYMHTTNHFVSNQKKDDGVQTEQGSSNSTNSYDCIFS